MSLHLGSWVGGRSPAEPDEGAVPAAPAARRTTRPSWRDPRLVAGVVIVALCVLGGARLMAGADDTVAVWAARRDLPAGTALSRGVLVEQRVHFADGTDAGRYLTGTVPSGTTVSRDVGAGELLPRAALTDGGGADVVEVPLSVAPDDLPATVRRGSVVDVWVLAEGTTAAQSAEVDGGAAAVQGSASRGVRVLTGVTVLDVPAEGDSLAPSTTRQVIVGVPASQDLSGPLGRLAAGRLVLTRKS